MKKNIYVVYLVLLFVLLSASESTQAQSVRVFHGNHFEYCCQDSDVYFSDCDDPDYSIPYTITISNTEIKLKEKYSDGREKEYKYRITGKQFCGPDNAWYFYVIDDDGEEDIIGVGADGDYIFFIDADDYEICTMVYYMHE